MKNRTFQAFVTSQAVLCLMLGALLCFGSSAFAQNSTIFGPNVYVFTPSTSVSTINSTLTTLAGNTEFSTNRYAVFFEPGTYTGVESEVGFYESVAGLGETPSAVYINNGYLTSNQTDSNGNLTTNFWRSLENMEITAPSGDVLQWGVSQGSDFRRMYVNNAANGGMELANTACGWSSGGFIANSQIAGVLNACSQQQWYTRNSSIGSFTGYVWNYVFSGVSGAPAQSNPFSNDEENVQDVVLATTPVVREKPFLYMDSSSNYWVFSPSLRTNSSGTDWSNGGLGAGTSLAISTFLIATPSTSLATINAWLATAGQNLILTPGIYQYSGAINVVNANTVVLGLGYADLVPKTGTAAITVADVDGVQLAGFLIDAGPVNSAVLLQIGVAGAARVSHASNPTSISDVSFRVGGATAGTCTEAMEVDSDNVIIDNLWSWRADHGTDASWTGNVCMNGLVVNGDNVTALGLAVEHYEAEQVVWNGQGGETIFYQSEMPYDVPSQAAWMNGSVDGYASYNVAPSVTTHTAYGLGVYSYFNQGVAIIANSGIAAPVAAGVTFTDSVSVWLTGSGQINYNIASNSPGITDNGGVEADSASPISDISSWGGSSGSCSAIPSAPTGVTTSGATSSSLNVSWTAVTPPANCSISSYSVYRSTVSGFTPSSSNLIASSVTGTSYSNTGLAASTTYYYVIEAVDAKGTSGSSAQASGTTSGGASCAAVPSAPTGLTAAATSSSAIGLNWTAVTPPANCTISSYTVYGGTTANPTTVIASGVTGASYTNSGLAASTTYYYLVKAVDSYGASAASAQASAKTQAASTGASVVSINAGGAAVSNSGGGDNSFVADEDYVGGATYSVTHTITIPASIASTAAPAAVYQTAREQATTYTIPGLTSGSSYTVRLHFAELYFTAAASREFNVAINGTTVLTNFDIYKTAGAAYTAVVENFTATANSSGQIVIAFTNGAVNVPEVEGIEVLGSTAACAAVPSAPAGLTATASSSSVIGLTWTAVTPPANCAISSYSVYRSTTSGFTPSSSNLVASSVTTASYSNTGLAASTTYYFIVKALDSYGTSAASAQANAKTQAAASCTTVPSAPTGLTATASSSSVIGLSWTTVTPPANCTISSYSVYRSTTSGFTPSSTTLVASGLTSASYSNTGLAASTAYYFIVEALDADGTSAASAQATATTQAAASGTEFVAIAAGGPAQSNSGGGDYSFVADEDFSGGQNNSVSTATINLTQPGANAAPMGVYQHARNLNSTYTIPGLTAGTQHTVLLHFAETYFNAAGARQFNVAINGTNVLTNLDIYATVGANAALVKSFTATANSSGQIVIALTQGAANQPVISGIEIR